MPLIDMYRRELQRKRDEIAKLFGEKAKIQKNISDHTTKGNKAREAASRSKSDSTIRGKLKEAERCDKSAAQEAGKLSKIEAKIASKNKDADRAEKKVSSESEKLEKQKQKKDDEYRKKQDKTLDRVNTTLSHHERKHHGVANELARLKSLPDKVTIAMFAANPLGQSQLRLDEEARGIEDMLRKSLHRNSIEFRSFWAVRPLDILQSLNECSPAIVHFSGHGSDADELVLQDNSGQMKLVSKEAIIQTMLASASELKLVFLNTCHSAETARRIADHVEVAIGMSSSVGDEAARVFASQFYSAIGFGLSVAKAFEQAKAALLLEGIPEGNVPEMYCQGDPDSLVLVRPEGVVK